MNKLQEYMDKINHVFIIQPLFELESYYYIVCNYLTITEKIKVSMQDLEDIKAENIYVEEILNSYIKKLSEQMYLNKYYKRIRKIETILEKP